MDEQPARVVETHISVLFFVGDRAYKLKKPVRFPFLDLTDRDRRTELCHAEVALNRRLAPDVYLGVAEVRGPAAGEAESLVVMRRMPDDRRLSTMVAASDPRVPAALDALATLLAAFHAAADRSPAIDAAGAVEAVLARWEENFEELAAFARAPGDAAAGVGVDAGALAEARLLAHGLIAGRGPLYASRVTAGAIVDGHGDLQAADVFCLDDGPRVLDCIEFDPALRYGDVIDDVAFLVMDLERLGAADLARRFLDAYQVAAGAVFPAVLLDTAIAYRAQVRAKVACLRAAQQHDDPVAAAGAWAEATAELALCRRHLERGRSAVVLVGGLPGTGKSTVAAGLLARHELGDADLVRSDAIRRELGLAGRYDAESVDAVYRTMLDQARVALGTGRSVILDATWSSRAHRAVALAMADEFAAAVVPLRCELDAAVAAARIERRRAEGVDPSEATPAVAAALAAGADPWPEATVIDTAGPADAVIDRAAAVVRAAVDERIERVERAARVEGGRPA